MFFATSAMPCRAKKSTKMLPRAFQKHLSNQHPNLHRFWNQLGSILGGLWEPSWGQVGTKWLQKSIPKTTTKSLPFGSLLGAIFDDLEPQHASQEGAPEIDFRMFSFSCKQCEDMGFCILFCFLDISVSGHAESNRNRSKWVGWGAATHRRVFCLDCLEGLDLLECLDLLGMFRFLLEWYDFLNVYT